MSWSTSASRAMTRSAVVRSASRKASVPAWTASDTRAPRRTTSSHSSLSSSWNAFLVSGRGGPPHLSPGRRLEPVADAPDGGQQAGAGRVGLDLAAQALHVYVQCLGVAHVVGTPHLIEKHEVGLHGIEQGEGLGSILGHAGQEALPAQADLERVYEGLLVLDDQHRGLGGGHGSSGRRSVNVDPSPSRDSTRTSPPWLDATWRTMARPSPEPPVPRPRARSTR